MADPTLLDVARLNNADSVVGLIEESVATTPEMAQFSARSIKGISFEQVIRTALPDVGFRDANEGVAAVKSTYVRRRSECSLLDASVEVDKKVADRYEDGPDAFMAIEASGLMEAGMRSVASQIWYGRDTTVSTSTAASPLKGFHGMVEFYDTTDMVVNAGGGGATRSSVWFVKYGPKYVQLLLGEAGQFDVGETMSVRLTDGTDNPYDGFRKPLTAYIGLHCPNPRNSVVRIRNLTAANPLTDTLMYNAMELFPAGLAPDACFMTRRSLFQLRASRTATNATGQPAPIPTEFMGVPMYPTDSLVNTETA